jgi:predicted RNase H-like nuclease (RuvC/YqgF family)
MIKSKKPLLGLVLALLLAPVLSGQSLADAREIITELLQQNELLENRISELEALLTDRDERLTKLSTLLATIQAENETLKAENSLMKNLLQIAEALEKERRTFLVKLETERTVFMIATGVLGIGWGLDRVLIR